MCTESVINERVEKMYRRHVQQTRNRDIAVKALMRTILTSKEFEKRAFYKYKNNFLMIDRYPENATRFPFTYSDLEMIVIEQPLNLGPESRLL